MNNTLDNYTYPVPTLKTTEEMFKQAYDLTILLINKVGYPKAEEILSKQGLQIRIFSKSGNVTKALVPNYIMYNPIFYKEATFTKDIGFGNEQLLLKSILKTIPKKYTGISRTETLQNSISFFHDRLKELVTDVNKANQNLYLISNISKWREKKPIIQIVSENILQDSFKTVRVNIKFPVTILGEGKQNVVFSYIATGLSREENTITFDYFISKENLNGKKEPVVQTSNWKELLSDVLENYLKTDCKVNEKFCIAFGKILKDSDGTEYKTLAENYNYVLGKPHKEFRTL